MRYLIILLLFFLANCSGYTIASLSTNVITYSATGKTNSDHVISFVTGKDCAITSTLKQQDYCQEHHNFHLFYHNYFHRCTH